MGSLARTKSCKETTVIDRTDEKEQSPRSRLELRLRAWDDSRSRSGCSIYVVPGRLRRGNEEAYTPRVISIGPLHHGKEHLQAMEANKSRYVSAFLHRLPYHLSDFIEVAQKLWEKRARDFYQNIFNFSPDEFVTMILVDGIFIVELLMRNGCENMGDHKGDIFQKQWVRDELRRDMILLENQLPFFILEDLFGIAAADLGLTHSIRYLAYKYFGYDDPKHFGSQADNDEIYHIVHLIYRLFLFSKERSTKKNFNFDHTRSAAELEEVGVKFKVMTGSCSQVDIEFNNKDGTLKIPRFQVDEWTEPLFRNLIAYEQCHHEKRIIGSYIMLMDILINTPQDVDVLSHSKILRKSLEDEEVCLLFNSNLYKRTASDSNEFYYASVCEDLNKYGKDPWHHWKIFCYRSRQVIKREYSSNPLKFFSVIAGGILLGLTVIQTIFAFLSLKHPNIN